VVHLTDVPVANEEDTAIGVTYWARSVLPWALFAPATSWGREVTARLAVRLDTGLTGDAIDLERDGDDLIAWKPAFGGQLVAAIRCATRPQLATVRPGVLPVLRPRTLRAELLETRVVARSRLSVLARIHDDVDRLADASVVIGVGQGVDPSDYGSLDPLLAILGAELAATRKVADRGWLPRTLQIGITGRSISPRLFVSIGASGKFNHAVGFRTAATVLAVNPDPAAPIHEAADASIMGDAQKVIPILTRCLNARMATAPTG
jgi:electron transfer flavoprotein alpha subunit